MCAAFAYEMEFSFDSLDGDQVIPSAILKSANEAYERNLQGLEALEVGEYEKALDYFEQAAGLLPGYTDAVNNQGVVYFRRGILGRAREIWEEAVTADPRYAIGYHNLGVLAYHNHEYDQANEYFKRALAKDKQLVDAAVMLGRTHLQQNNPRKAVERLAKAYKINPAHQGAWGTYSFALLVKGDTASAVQILEKNQQSAEALEMLGKIEANRGRFARAARHFSKAVAAGGERELLVNCASVQLDNGDCEKALGSLSSYFKADATGSADAYLLAGVASKECGDQKKAEHYFQQGVRAYPDDPILRYNLGQIYFVNKQYEDAERVWRQVSDTLQDPALFHLRALSAYHTGKLPRAGQFVRKAIELDAKPQYYDLLGVILHARGKDREAAANFKKALKIDPEYRSAQLNLAIIDQSPEMLDATIEQARRAVDTCVSDCGEARLQLAILYYHRRQTERAVETLEAIPARERNEAQYRHLALFYRSNQNWDRASDILEKARDLLVVTVQTEYELAETYMQAGRFAQAVKAFNRTLERWTDNPWRIYYQLGYAHMELNELAEAKRYFALSLKSNDENVAARGLLAFIHNRLGDAEEARRLWKQNLKDDPTNPVLWINMGLSYEQKGEYGKALESYKKAQMLNDDKSLYINIGNAYAAAGRASDARHAYAMALHSSKRERAAYNSFILAQREKDRALAKKMYAILDQEFPASINTSRAAGELALWEGDTASGLAALEALPEKNEHDWQALARVYIARKQFDKARRALDALPDAPAWQAAKKKLRARFAFSNGEYKRAYALWKETDDTSFTTRYNMALAAYESKQYAQALSLGETLLGRARGADRFDLIRLLGNAAFGLRRWQEARSWYRQLTGARSRDPIVKYNLAVASYNLDEMERAWGYYQQARAADPSLKNEAIEKRWTAVSDAAAHGGAVYDSTDRWYNQAVELQNQKKDSAAASLYLRVLAADSAYVRAWNNLGAVYAAQGRLQEALRCYHKAIERRHDLVEAYANLVSIYIALDDLKNAKIWIFKGQAHNPDSELLAEVAQEVEEAIARAQKPQENTQTP